MPRGNRTGPQGAGPMTGRGAGYCAGFGAAGWSHGGRGGGMGRGMGRGGRRGGQWAAPDIPTPAAERDLLQQQARQLQQDLELIQARIKELDTAPNAT